MIEGGIADYRRYVTGRVWDRAFAFLLGLPADAETGRRALGDDGLYAGIDTYTTKAREAAVLETHERHVDIQVLLAGIEVIELYPRASLAERDPYDPARDATFYQIPVRAAPVRITLTPGRFAVFFPEDAHMPCLNAGLVPQPVRKVVVKVPLALLP